MEYDAKNDNTKTSIAMYTIGKWHIQTELHYPFEHWKVPNNMGSCPMLLDVRPITALYLLTRCS